MQPSSSQDYKQLLSEVIKKQIVILGPDITLSKARNVKGLVVAVDGTVTDVMGDPQQIIQALIDQFVQLSGLIVKKTMEPLLSLSQPSIPMQTASSSMTAQQEQQPPTTVLFPQQQGTAQQIQQPAVSPIPEVTTPATEPLVTPKDQPVVPPPNLPEASVSTNQIQSSQQIRETTSQNQNPALAKNPLAA